MVFRMLSGLLDKDQREIRKSKIKYDLCSEARRKLISEFRKHVAREVLFTHPDAKFLMNNTCDVFVAYSRDHGIVLTGRFDHIPQIDYVGPGGSNNDRSKALEKFAYDIKHPPKLGIDKKQAYELVVTDNDRKMAIKPYDGPCGAKANLFTNGFEFEDESASKWIAGACLYKNDILIGKSNWVSPQSVGHFSNAIYENVINNSDLNEHGISKLGFELVFFTYGSIGSTMYQIYYDDRQKFDTDRGFLNFRVMFGALAEFATSIESEFQTIPEELQDPQEGWAELLRNNL